MEGLYVHIPFCKTICAYCDFVKEAAKPQKQRVYVEALKKELFERSDKFASLKTVYIGGGTPSHLEVFDFEEVLRALRKRVPQALDEFSVECNPEDVRPELLETLKKYGVDRISLGVQTFKESHLRLLNRTHGPKDVENAVKRLRWHGFDNVNVDMMFAIPGQTLREVEEDLARVLALDVEHVSYYSLILEENTRFHRLYERGELSLVDEETEGTMYETVIDTLSDAGYTHYEISNFAKNGKECRHNLAIWKDGDYGGVGAGAHGKHDGHRRHNPERVRDYTNALQRGEDCCEIYPYEAKRDTLLMGLRLLKGIDLDEFASRFQTDLFKEYPELSKMIEKGLLKVEDRRLSFTRKGLLLGNEVFMIL